LSPMTAFSSHWRVWSVTVAESGVVMRELGF